MFERFGIVRYRGQFEPEPLPLLPPPPEPAEEFEDVLEGPVVVELPDPPPPEVVDAFGSDVEVTGVIGELLVEPSLVLPAAPPVLSPPDGRLPVVVEGVVELDVPGSAVEELPLVPSAPTPPVAPVALAAAELSCVTALLSFVPPPVRLLDDARELAVVFTDRTAAAAAAVG